MQFVSLADGKRFVNLAHVVTSAVEPDGSLLLKMKGGDRVSLSGADAEKVIAAMTARTAELGR